MSFFNWCEEPPRPKLPEKPELKELEIIIGEAPIEVKYDGELIGSISKINGVYAFNTLYGNYNSTLLKGIAAKLDELNGVDANNP